MKKNFSFNLLFLVLLNLLIKPIYVFGIEVGVQNEVGPTEYGLYYAMFNFTFLFNVLLDMGINNFQKIKVAADEKLGMANMGALLPIKLGLALVYVLATVIAALLLGFEGRYWFFIAWLMLNHVLAVFLLLLRANLSGMHLFLRDSVVSVIDRLILIAGIGYLLWWNTDAFAIEQFVWFQTGAYVCAILVAMVMTPNTHLRPNLSFKWAATSNILKQTWPFATLIMLMTAYNKLDGVMLERLAPDGLLEAGIYAQAYRIIDAGNSFAFLFAGMLLPVFARHFASDNRTGIKIMGAQAMRFLVLPAGLAVVLVLFHGQWMMNLLFEQQANASLLPFQWLMGSFLFICIGYVYGTLLTAIQQLRAMNITALIAVLINFGLNVWLIPEHGALGAAIASFSSLGVMTLMQLVIVHLGAYAISNTWIIAAAVAWSLMLMSALIVDQFVHEPSVAFATHAAIALAIFVVIGLRRSDLKTVLPDTAFEPDSQDIK